MSSGVLLRDLACCVLVPALAGCVQTRPDRFLHAGRGNGAESHWRARPNGLVIGLGPITLPQYLDRPDIVTREGANQMRLPEYHRWAEPLEPLLTRIMAEDLYALLDASDVIPLPQRGDIPLDRVVEVDVARFDATQEGEVVLDARWRIYQGDNETLITSGRSLSAEPSAPLPDYDAVVAAMSRAVGQVSREIARAIEGPPPVPTRRAKRAG